MDTLPVELLRLVFEHCDAPTARKLRLVSPTLADIGYDYMMPSHFTALGWRDDVERLHSIASHKRLQASIRSLTFNFSEVDEFNARHASYFQHFIQDPEKRQALLDDTWSNFYQLEQRRRRAPPFSSYSPTVVDSFRELPNLTSLTITYATCPYEIDVLKRAFRDVPNCRKIDPEQACKNLNTIVSALVHVKLTSLTIDRVPLEIFRAPENRRHWFDCGGRAFENLQRLDLTLDPTNIRYPSAKLRAVNGLGRVLQFSSQLTHLSLIFQSHHNPREKFMLSFRTLLEGFVFRKLTDLRLEGISCVEQDLRLFLAQHGATLERVRLGGRGLAKPFEASLGGVHICQGTFESMFTSLRGKLPKLKRLHMEGDFSAGDDVGGVRELYNFHATTDDNWQPVGGGVPAATSRPPRSRRLSLDCLDIERFLLEGGQWPKLARSRNA